MKKIKFIKRQDSGFKLSYGNSGETSLNLSNEIFDFISKRALSPGEERNVIFRIFKEDCIKAMSFIIMKLPLYKSSSNYSNKVDNYLEIFGELYSKIESFFGSNKEAEYKVSLLYRPDGRIYLKGLRVNGFSIRDYLVENYSALQFDNEGNDILNLRVLSDIEDNGEYDDESQEPEDVVSKPLQQIFYGAPGTGKSNTIKRTVDDQGKICFRTTFHPDSDYSTFVGCYKPTMKRSTITKDGVTTREEKIVYRFEPQTFTNAYVQAWNSKEEVYLVIEEINRGNCAQIFGDLFQLLDRKNGESEYPINADTALADYLQVALADSNRDDIPAEVKSGMKLKLPSNLYIWATMNTSDQSLFPIDSAFKRRWDWIYIPIKQHDEGYRIKIDTVTYGWWGFLEEINQVIGDTTSSEDKKLGYFFVKAEGKEIGADKFVSKVLFYLWNDVFKNYGFDNPIFSRGENKKFAFSDFFTKEGAPETSMVNQFLRKLDETIDKENSFEKIPDVNDAPSSLMVKYNGEFIEGTSARNKYVELLKLVVAEKGGEQVANCIGAELTRTPAEGSTRMYKPIGDTGWYLATNIGIDAIKKNISKIQEALDVNIEIE